MSALTLFPGCNGLWLGDDLAVLDYTIAFNSSPDIDATGEKASFSGRFWHPSGPGNYTVRRVGFRFGSSVTKAGGSALTGSLQTTDLAAGPPIRPDETQDQTFAIANGDSTFAANTWHRSAALSADRTVAFGELLSFVLEYDGSGRLGADVFRLGGLAYAGRGYGQLANANKVGAPAWAMTELNCPNIVLECDDGSFGTLFGAVPASAITNTIFGPTSATDEYAVKFTVPVECKADAARFALQVSSDTDIILYDSSSSALATVSIDSNSVRSANSYPQAVVFSSAITLSAATTYRLAVKPTAGTTSSCILTRWTFPDANFVPLHGWASGSCESRRADAGSWTDDSTNLLAAGLRISHIHDGAASGGGGSSYIIGG